MALNRMNSVSLAPTVFGVFFFALEKHGTDESVCDCRKKQNCSSLVKLAGHHLGHGQTVQMDNFYNSALVHEVRKKRTILERYVLTGKMFILY